MGLRHSVFAVPFSRPVAVTAGLAAFLIGLLLVGGCDKSPEQSFHSKNLTSEGPVVGGTAVIALATDPGVLNPLIYTSTNAGLVFAEIHDGLTEMADDLTYQPRIASGWEVAPDGLAVTYRLRPWRWSDGRSLTATDVVNSFHLFKDPRVASPRRGLLSDVVDAVAIDSMTVRYTLARPQPDPIQRTWHHILPFHVTEHLDPADVRNWALNHDPLSSGEFLLEDWTHNRSVSLVRNPEYPGRSAHLDRVVFRIMPEEGARLVALETGEVDLVGDVPPDAAKRLESGGKVRIAANGGRKFYYLQWNFANTLFASPEVRKAMSLAVDRARMVETLLLGYGQPANGPIPSVLWNHNDELEADGFDPDLAREILARTGWRDLDGNGVLEKDGREFRFEILTRQGDPVRENGSVILRENLGDVGIEVTIVAMELAAGLDRLRAGKFDSYFGRLNANLFGDPSGYVKSTAVDEFNSGHYANAKVDSLLNVALGIPDREAALPIWKNLQEILAEDPPAAYLFYPENLVGIGPRLQNVRPHLLSPINNLAEWWIALADRKYASGS